MAPFLLHIVWHPAYLGGADIADRLREHFGSHRWRSIVGGAGVRVVFRSEGVAERGSPLSVGWDDAKVVAAVVLVDRSLAGDAKWVDYLRTLSDEADAGGLSKRVFPVAMEREVLENGLAVQALRWDRWHGDTTERQQRLLRELAHGFSRMLRHYLEMDGLGEREGSLAEFRRKIQVFLSHSKHDPHGEPVADAMRDWLHQHSELASFMDVRDIPAGLSFEDVIDDAIQTGILVAIYTDSYSSREWCRREVLTAKRRNLPIVVVDCLDSLDERAFPYLGNVPVIRMSPKRLNRLDRIAGLLMDETFKDLLWQCRVQPYQGAHPKSVFLSRSPELLSLATLPLVGEDAIEEIVHPDPMLSVEEKELFKATAPGVRLHALSEWLRENQA